MALQNILDCCLKIGSLLLIKKRYVECVASSLLQEFCILLGGHRPQNAGQGCSDYTPLGTVGYWKSIWVPLSRRSWTASVLRELPVVDGLNAKPFSPKLSQPMRVQFLRFSIAKFLEAAVGGTAFDVLRDGQKSLN